MKSIAEAPSKAIITGEHFVVHGAWALAAALPKKVRVEVRESSAFRVVSDRFQGAGARALTPVSALVEAMAREFSFSPALKVSIASQIPEGAGLGSSASTMVAVASALARFRSLKLGPGELVRLSMVGEQEIHGRPSGVDPAICALGGVILFRRGKAPKKVAFKGTRTLLVSFSGKRRSTKRQISRVSSVKESFPSLFDGLTEAASEVSLMAAGRLAAGDIKGLGRLLNFNHAVLSTLGVSNESLDRLVDLSLSLGSYGAKLTGAGGGGSVVSVAPEGKEKRIISGLKARGFETFRAVVPTGGVKSWLEQ
ncbi:MAG: mevalonate kinase [Thaumarchaeota archaeon]|nr:mevalonate kinase [Nitrososphaerota archaeon]